MCQCSLTCHDLSLWHPEPWRFVTTRWQYPGRRSYSYICYRLTVAGFFFVWTMIDMATYGPGPTSRWLIHITNWSKLLLLMDVLLQASLTCHYQLWKLRRRPPGAPVVHEVSFNSLLRLFYAAEWVVTTVCGVFAIVTVFVAFIEEDSSGAFRAARYFTSLLYVLADHLLHNQPKHMLHVFYALFLHGLYIVFEAVYVLAGGTAPDGSSVIDGLDWGRLETAGFVSLSVFLVFVGHALLWLLARLREVLYSCVAADHAIKLPLSGAPGAQQVPYGATRMERQDPEGGHPSPPITEKHQPGRGLDTDSPSEPGRRRPSDHQPMPSTGDPGHRSHDNPALEGDLPGDPAGSAHRRRPDETGHSPGARDLDRGHSPGARDPT